MNKIVIEILSILLLSSCSSKKEEIQRISIKPQVLNEEILTVMPGDLVLAGDYIVWSDPFSADYFLNVHNALNGNKIGKMGKVGQGPKEFVSPLIDRHCVGNNIFAQDANGKTVGHLSIDSLIKGQEPFNELSEYQRQLQMRRLDKNLYLENTQNGEENYFKISANGKKTFFGVYPIPEIKKHVGGYEAYDARSGMFVYASFTLPYLSLYKKDGDTFQLLWENISEQKNYSIMNGEVIFDRKIRGISDVCMSKDYIVTLERDRKVDPMDESTVGRNASKCPRTVFLYDFNGKLLKIVDLGMPVMRIAADRRSNVLYTLGVNPDFVLSKYEL